MKIKLLLFLALILAVTLSLFPDIARHIMVIEIFGWHFETKQGTFIIMVLMLLFTIEIIQRISLAIVAGPGHIWQTLRNGSRQRREHDAQTALQAWLNLELPMQTRVFKKAARILPDWAQPLMQDLATLPHKIQPLDAQASPMQQALAAQRISDPEWQHLIDPERRKNHLEAWISLYPDALLPHIRLLDVHMEAHAWHPALALLCQLKNQPLRSQAWILEQKVRVYLALAQEEPKQAAAYLKQAAAASPHHEEVVLMQGQTLHSASKPQEAEALWLKHLKKYNHRNIAQALLPIMQRDDALLAFRRIEKIKGSHALSWVQACLAHRAKLDGLANELLKKLLQQEPETPLFWQTQAQWYSEQGASHEAQEAYERAITLLSAVQEHPNHSTEQ